MSTSQQAIEVRSESVRSIHYGLARTLDERMEAFSLVHEAYVRAGLSVSNAFRLRITPYHLLPTSELFVASVGGEVFFTMSLIGDGRLGLPMESIYPEEVASRRAQGIRVAEVGSLADRRNSAGRGFFPIFCGISRYVAQFAVQQGIQQLLITVHPRHAPFYQRLLGFEVIGEERSYPTVRNRPAVPLSLNFETLESAYPKGFKTLFGQRVADEELRPHPMLAEDTAYLASLVDPDLAFNTYDDAGLAASSVRT